MLWSERPAAGDERQPPKPDTDLLLAVPSGEAVESAGWQPPESSRADIDGRRAESTFLSRLAAQIPPPRFHMLSYYGVLAPAASRRAEIVPGPGPDVDEVQSSCNQRKSSTRGVEETNGVGKPKRPRPERMLWAQLLRKVFLHDALRCQCGGRRRVLAMIFKPESIDRILRHLGLPHESPARAPPRPPPARLPFPA